MAKGKPKIKKNATLAIHNAQGMAVGDQNNMRATADVMEKTSNIIAKEYANVSA